MRKFIQIGVPIICILIGGIVISNKQEKEDAAVRETNAPIEARREYVKNFITNDTSAIMANLNGLAKFIDSCRFDNNSYTGTYLNNYTTELIDSVSGNPVIIFDPKFGLKGDEEYLKETQRGNKLKNYSIRFDFSPDNKDIIASTIITYKNNETITCGQNETSDFNQFINRNTKIVKELMETVAITKEADKRTAEFKRRKEQFVDKQLSKAEIKLSRKVKDRMNDPSSFESDGSWVFPENDGRVRVIMQYREKNVFGAKVLKRATGYFSEEGELLEYSFE